MWCCLCALSLRWRTLRVCSQSARASARTGRSHTKGTECVLRCPTACLLHHSLGSDRAGSALLLSPLYREEKAALGRGLLLSLCRDPHDTVCVLSAVSGAALQTQTVPGTLVHSRLAPARHGCQQVSHQPLGLAARPGHGTPPSRAERTSSLLESLESPVARARSFPAEPTRTQVSHSACRLPLSSFGWDETGNGITGRENHPTDPTQRHLPDTSLEAGLCWPQTTVQKKASYAVVREEGRLLQGLREPDASEAKRPTGTMTYFWNKDCRPKNAEVVCERKFRMRGISRHGP